MLIFLKLRPSGVYLDSRVSKPLDPNSIQYGSRLGEVERKTYFKSFSIRSTWVMTMRRQQYRLQPSWSRASLSVDG